MPLVRLDKLLALQGFGTRRQIRELVRAGKVRVGGEAAKSADEKVNPETERIFVDGGEIVYKEHVYIMMNKPRGVISATSDPKQRTVLDLLPPSLRRPGLFPAGRLDKDTEGLLLITDDGAFAHRILSPAGHVGKTYLVTPDRPADAADAEAFRSGVVLDDGYRCLPAELRTDGGGTYVTIREGKFHQVKRMFEARGKQVLALKRLSMGGLLLDEKLRPGECRELFSWEKESIK